MHAQFAPLNKTLPALLHSFLSHSGRSCFMECTQAQNCLCRNPPPPPHPSTSQSFWACA